MSKQVKIIDSIIKGLEDIKNQDLQDPSTEYMMRYCLDENIKDCVVGRDRQVIEQSLGRIVHVLKNI